MLRESQRIISVDDHVIEPADLWTSRLPTADVERGPQVRQESDGTEAWYFEGRRYPTLALNAVAGMDFEDFNVEPTRFDQIRPGCYQQKARLEDMDIDGVHAALCFPSFSRFCGQTFAEADDRDLGLRCIQAYNDFMVDEWSAGTGGRLLPLAIVPLWDGELAGKELRRAVDRGCVAATVSENPAALGLPSYYDHEYWAPLFRAAEELDVPLCMHIGSGSKQIDSDAPEAGISTRVVLVGLNSMLAATDLVLSSTFDHFPNLKVVLSEGGVGWVPYILERLEYTWPRYRHMENLCSSPPAETMKSNIWFAMIDDVAGLALRETIGVEHIMWESDYPHADTSWPNSRKRLTSLLADVPDDEVALIVETNAHRLFRMDSLVGT